MEPLRLGFLSTAAINTWILEAVRESDLVEVVAVASRSPERAEGYAREHAIPRAHGSYEAFLADPEIEAVYISLPNALHTAWSIKALEAGKHVLCEKPFSARAADVERAFGVAGREGLVLTEAFMYRHHPQSEIIRQLVAGGAVGQVRTIRATLSADIAAIFGPEDVRFRADLDGGALLDMGTYCVSLSRLIAGEPVRVYGEPELHPGGVDMSFYGMLRFPGEIVAVFTASLGLPLEQRLEVVGSKGTLFVPGPVFPQWAGKPELRRAPANPVDRQAKGATDVIDVPEADVHYRLEMEDFAAAIRTGRPPLLDAAECIAQARVLEALATSSATGGPVDLRS
jgi:D-xylose 1-dehydrogenase (NADP+, D-xylono-1,5-lactone-forming)